MSRTHLGSVLTTLMLWTLVVPLLGGCSVSPATGKRQLVLIPEDQEIAMGIQAVPQMEKEFNGKVPNDRLQAYVTSVGKRMAAVAERQMPYEFTLVASDVPNAFALPGGKIFVTAGLMQRLNNERQLAGVLGHEIGHVTDRHNVQGLQRQMGADVFAQVVAKAVGGQSADMAKAGAQIAGSMVTLKYGRQDEYTADQLGVRYLAKAGYNPWGMVEVLEVLQSLSKTEPGKLAEMFQTHPLTSKRVAEAVAIVQRDQPRAKLAEGDPNAARFMEMRNLLAQTLGH